MVKEEDDNVVPVAAIILLTSFVIMFIIGMIFNIIDETPDNTRVETNKKCNHILYYKYCRYCKETKIKQYDKNKHLDR